MPIPFRYIYAVYFLLSLSISINGREGGEEYLYPVASTEYENQVYVLYQKSLTHIELWLWDSKTKAASKALLSSFNPAGISPIPDNLGFSFIDNGRVKVKLHSKRSPKSLEWYEPVYDIGALRWIDANCYYFHAKEREHYGIFHGTLYGDIDTLIAERESDYMYPQKQGTSLFCIVRTPSQEEGHYSIIHTPYPIYTSDSISPFNNTQQFEQRVAELLATNAQSKKPLIKNTDIKTILTFGAQPIAFLQMLSEYEGFCIGHPSHINKHDATMTLICYYLYADSSFKVSDSNTICAGAQCGTSNGSRTDALLGSRGRLDSYQWHAQELFTFDIPLELLLPDSSARLYESIAPLLPHYEKDVIYFVDTNRPIKNTHGPLTASGKPLALYTYNRSTGEILPEVRLPHVHQYLFPPIRAHNALIYGGSISQDENTGGAPRMWLNNQGILSIELCSVQQK